MTEHQIREATGGAAALEDAELPIIDIAGLFSGDLSDIDTVADAIGHAAETSGFFYIREHGVAPELIEAAYAASRAFHAQSRDAKMRNYIGLSTNHRGYAGPDELMFDGDPDQKNHHETFDLSFEAPGDHPDCLAGYRFTGPNQWPPLPGFQEAVSAYYKAVFDVGLAMMKAVERYLEVEPGSILQNITAPTSQLRLLHYLENDAPSDDKNVGIGAHSDFECFTILHQGGPGLQVLGSDGVWRAAPPQPGCFVVNIGDCLEAWTGGRFKSTKHRVPNSGRERFSMPLFFGLDYHTVVQPAPKFRTPEAVEKYKPFVAGQHLMAMTMEGFRYLQRLRDQGLMRPAFLGETEALFKREGAEL